MGIAELIIGVDTLWVLLAAFLVFFMQAGFGMVEAGFIRAKNTCNILTKNFLDFCMASIGFFIFGYAIMFGEGNSLLGLKGWFMLGAESGADVPLYAFWLFQAAFCGAAATIVAGGMGMRATGFFQEYGIETIVGVQGAIGDVIKELLDGTLQGGESLCTPGAGKGYGLDKTECDHPHQETCEHEGGGK